jgi:hypothetical protein
MDVAVWCACTYAWVAACDNSGGGAGGSSVKEGDRDGRRHKAAVHELRHDAAAVEREHRRRQRAHLHHKGQRRRQCPAKQPHLGRQAHAHAVAARGKHNARPPLAIAVPVAVVALVIDPKLAHIGAAHRPCFRRLLRGHLQLTACPRLPLVRRPPKELAVEAPSERARPLPPHTHTHCVSYYSRPTPVGQAHARGRTARRET